MIPFYLRFFDKSYYHGFLNEVWSMKSLIVDHWSFASKHNVLSISKTYEQISGTFSLQDF